MIILFEIIPIYGVRPSANLRSGWAAMAREK